ncbi:MULTISPECIES: sugar ABC transporter substrate-binding protein [unclassified Xanthomonas]|uniref:ABC transporter substrate-binding protein n=1 Tax=unclassified Xanthomonas TaxID=2643310 RepID=UPI002B22BE84|nr:MULTISPECIES: sugar ABC transporter substrate-binding protein [unclassified Xanthomonas]MEA9563895.1 sugar ABC transporter substrate-binding protein [Xanthomonas sp. WHRI 8932A]MEA9634776.1 sugar ABC transporter substrate-binding protein [Xanthomonas sp. WHRI 8812E]
MNTSIKTLICAALSASLAACGGGANNSDAASKQDTLVIATVNNGDMIRMQKLTSDFTATHPQIKLEWVTLEENVLRQRVTTDIATKGGQFDVLTIGTYEVPIWAERGWLKPLTFDADYQVDDLIPQIRDAVSHKGQLYAAPFYAEGSMLMYRTDLLQKAGLSMPAQPSWSFVADAARKMTDKQAGIYGICLRGKAGWGENMALISSMGNAFGARWFDEQWKPQFDQPEWKAALQTYVDVMKDAGPPGAASNGFNENLALFTAGKCAMWVDATVAASFISNPSESKVSDKVGFAAAPDAGKGKTTGWLWAWNLAIPASSKKADKAQAFIAWATSKHYTELVAGKEGWGNVPPGTRQSLYATAEYLKAAPFAKQTLAAIQGADTHHPTVKPVPYVGVQYAAIPEFQSIGTTVGQQFSAALTGSISVDEALKNAQAATEREMQRAGYPKR